MAEETTAAVEEERELASQPIPGLVRKYTIITARVCSPRLSWWSLRAS